MTDTDNLSPIPEETKKIFEEFFLFIELNGPGPEPKTDEPSLSAEERTELQMFERFLDECRVPEDLRRRIKRRYIEEEFIRRKKRGIMTWGWRFISAFMLITGIRFWWSSPVEFPAYALLVFVIFSALFFWVGQKIEDQRYEIQILRIVLVSILGLGSLMWWLSPKEFPPLMAPYIVITSALIFWLGERRKH